MSAYIEAIRTIAAWNCDAPADLGVSGRSGAVFL
jgi:hypothetical protein